MKVAVVDAYHELDGSPAVAVRSSATAEDTADTSFAGMHETYTWVSDDGEVLRRIRDCWTSVFTLNHHPDAGGVDGPGTAEADTGFTSTQMFTEAALATDAAEEVLTDAGCGAKPERPALGEGRMRS